MKTCSIDECDRKHYGRGWCRMHYHRWYTRGDVSDPERNPLSDRFWSKVERVGDNRCWEWTASRKPVGYGQFTVCVDGRRINAYAHRTAWELTNGPIPGDLHVLHHCDNRGCCNPAHLWLGTPADNMADMHDKGRFVHWTWAP
jgi:hypothetical protein